MSYNKKTDAVVAWMHFVCKLMYCCGLGDYWYEPSQRSILAKRAYAIFAFMTTSYFCGMICCEIASLFSKTDILPAERQDVIRFAITHGFIGTKLIFMVIHRERIKTFLRMMLVTTRELYVNEQIEREQMRKTHVYCFTLAFSMFAALLTALTDAVVRNIRTGLPWRLLVTAYPDSNDTSWAAYGFQTFATIFVYHFITSMVASDLLVISSLIYVAFKFKSLQSYFVSLGIGFKENPMQISQEALEDEIRTKFIQGIKLHKETLWCANNIQHALGNVYSCQVTQSLGLLVSSLIKLVVTNDRSLIFLIATCTFILCVLILTGVYMWNAGEITYEASLVSDSMLYSGWYLCSARARMKKLVVVGMINSQVPVVMTAFGILELSYENFITILKNSYSVFAVIY